MLLCMFWITALSQADDQANGSQETEQVDWEKITGGETFHEKKIEKPKDQLVDPEYNDVDYADYYENDSFWDSNGFRYIAVTLLVLIIIGLVVAIIANQKSNTKIARELEHSIEEAEKNIDTTNLDYLLQKALDNGEYRLALRIYYLKVIKLLNEKSLINFKPEKTNYNYVVEMMGHNDHKAFKSLTTSYEYFWYGDKDINEDIYQNQTRQFSSFINKIERDGEK